MTGKSSATRRKPPITFPRRVHRALHDFTDDLRRKLNKSVSGARSRQLGAARHVEQVIRDLLSRDNVDGNNGMAINADLEAGLQRIDTKELAHRGKAWSDAIHALEEYEGAPFPRTLCHRSTHARQLRSNINPRMSASLRSQWSANVDQRQTAEIF